MLKAYCCFCFWHRPSFLVKYRQKERGSGAMLLLERYQREVLTCVALAGTVAAVLLLWWSRGKGKGRSSVGAGTNGSKKPLAHTPGIRAVCVQVKN